MPASSYDRNRPRPRRRPRLFLGILALLSCLSQTLAGEPERKRCAVIASPECDQAGLGDLLTAKLAAIEGVELVERELVRKVLAEHRLTAAGLTSPQGAIQLGKLLSADAFLAVERVPKTTPPACRIQVIETRTGIALGMELLAEESLTKDIAPVARLLKSSVARLGVPVEKRHYVALLGFRSEEPGRALDGLAEAFGMLLMTDLAKSPGIVVLDREHLDALTKEAGITGIDLQLKASAILIDGALKRLPDERKLGATILLRPLAGGAEQRVSVSVPEGDIGGARQALAEAVAKALGSAPASQEAITPEQEAAIFLSRVGPLMSLNDTVEAVSAGEAALALHPTQETRLAALSAWQYRSWHLRSPWSAPSPGSAQPTGPRPSALPELPTERKIQAARAYLRSLTLLLEFCHAHVPKKDAANADDLRLPGGDTYYGSLGFQARPDEPAVKELLDEVDDLEERAFRFAIAYYAEHYDLCGFYYWHTWGRALPGLHGGQPERHIQVVRQAVEAFANPPGDKGKYVMDRLDTLALWPVGLQRLTPRNLERGGGTSIDREAHVALCRELAGRHQDPYIRLIGYAGLVCMEEDEVASAHALLDAFLRDFPPEHPWRTKQNDYIGFAQPVWRAFRALSIREPQALDAYGQRIVTPWIEKGDPGRLAIWRDVLKSWFYGLGLLGRYDAIDALAARAHEVLVKPGPQWRPEEAARLARDLEEKRRECAERLGRAAGPDSAWADYTLRPLPLGRFGFGPNQELACLLLARGKLICVHGPTVGNAGRDSLIVTVKAYDFPQGGAGTLIGEVPLTAKRRGAATVKSAALAGDTVYVGTGAGLVAFSLRGGEPKVTNESNGLPSEEILALAALDGKLYIGFGPVVGLLGRAAFGCREPDGSFRLIASTTASEARSGLDGGERYMIHAIVSDAERKCLWLGVEGDQNRNGVWRYTPATDKLDRPLAERWGVRNLAWSGQSLLAGIVFAGLVRVDPGNLSCTWLLAYSRGFVPTGCSAPPVYGSPQVGEWPASLDGDRLITGGMMGFGFLGLKLHRKGLPPAALDKGPDGQRLLTVEHFLETPSGLLVVTSMGRAYLITRKGSPEAK